jgi:HEAT repeat protein
MPHKPSLEEELAQLRGHTRAEWPAEGENVVRQALRRGSNIAAAKTAALAAEQGLEAFLPDLAAAFERFMKQPGKIDKGCLAKLAIVDALAKLGYEGDDVYLQGVRHVQMEPVWGGKADTAANLRGNCGMALACANHPDALYELAGLLMDKEPMARRAAIKALAYMGSQPCELMLRVKAMAGDAEPDIVGDCLSTLMQIAPERSLRFVAGFLDSGNRAIEEEAALALGESRTPEAFEILRRVWETHFDRETRSLLLLPMALTRSEDAFSLLIDVVLNQPTPLAVEAVAALRVLSESAERQGLVRSAVAERGEARVAKAYAEVFDTKP